MAVLNYSDSPKHNFPQSHPLRVAIEDFQKKFGWEGNISLLFKKDVSDSEMKAIHEKIQKHSLVFFIENKNDLLDTWTNSFNSRREKI